MIFKLFINLIYPEIVINIVNIIIEIAILKLVLIFK